MFRKKKMLYEDKQYLLLLLSIMSDISLYTCLLCFVAGCINSSVLSLGLGMLSGIGMPTKVLDIMNIKYYKKLGKIKLAPLIILQFLISLPCVLYWVFSILLFI